MAALINAKIKTNDTVKDAKKAVKEAVKEVGNKKDLAARVKEERVALEKAEKKTQGAIIETTNAVDKLLRAFVIAQFKFQGLDTETKALENQVAKEGRRKHDLLGKPKIEATEQLIKAQATSEKAEQAALKIMADLNKAKQRLTNLDGFVRNAIIGDTRFAEAQAKAAKDFKAYTPEQQANIMEHLHRHSIDDCVDVDGDIIEVDVFSAEDDKKVGKLREIRTKLAAVKTNIAAEVANDVAFLNALVN